MSKTKEAFIKMREQEESGTTPANTKNIKPVKLKTINVKGKPYVEVKERIKYFRANYAGHTIETDIIEFNNEYCIFRATVKNEFGRILSTGYAHEVQAASYINNTSFIENAETSAIGRALGTFGIGIDTSIASADEVQNAILNQGKKPLIEKTRFEKALIMVKAGEYSKQELINKFLLNDVQLKALESC